MRNYKKQQRKQNNNIVKTGKSQKKQLQFFQREYENRLKHEYFFQGVSFEWVNFNGIS